MSLETHKLYAFGDFRLDLNEEVLLRNSTPLNLTPKAFQVLKILVRNHGHIVDKQTLISEIWGDTFVEDGNLAVNLALLRKVLGDDASHPIYIQTIARRGYRFIAPVEEGSLDHSKTDVLGAKNNFGPRRLTIAVVTPVLLIGLFVFVAWVFSIWPFTTATAPILSRPFRSEQLTSSGSAGAAAISPDGKYVAFTENNNGKWSVWLRQLVTGENIQVAQPSDEVYSGLTFSRNGELLYFVRGQPGTRLDLYRVAAFGGVPVKLVERTEGWISVSPDNKRISFVRCLYDDSDFCSLFVADADGKNEKRMLTKPRPIRIGDNQFSPDGRTIAFASGTSATGSNDFTLSKIDLESGQETEIGQRKFFDISSLKWLPGGSDLLFSAREHLGEKNSLWSISTKSGLVAQITNDGLHYGRFTLDEEARKCVAVRIVNDHKVWIANIHDLSNPRILTDGEYAGFMSDGTIVYQSNNNDIWTISSSGDERRQLTNDPRIDINPIVSAEMRYIFFTSNRLGSNQVWRMNADGTGQQQISSIDGGYPRFATPDGKWVYYQSSLTERYRKVAVDGSEEFPVPEIDGFGHAFSSDGKMMAYFFRDPKDGPSLRIGIRDLSDASLLKVLRYSDGESNPRNIVWSYDNQTLYFITKSNGKFSLWRTSLDHDRPIAVGSLGTDELQQFSISPDGRTILTVRGGWRQDAFLITGLN